jgi:membrane-associated phospholipid phosphatase
MGMGMGMGMGMAGWPAGAVPSELAPRPFTLDFTPDLAHPDFPARTIPSARWSYDDKLWDGSIYALLALREFAGQAWNNYDLAAARPDLFGWRDANAAVKEAFVLPEIQLLRNFMESERERYMTEILVQHDNAPGFWVALLGLTDGSKPKTCLLMQMALRCGEMAAIYFKRQFSRVRPSVVCPGLAPPFGPPGHPSFPSGHATQAWLLSIALKAATPKVAGTSIYADQLDWLAQRVAVNRERAGLHYPSDSEAGKVLATELFANYLSVQARCPTFHTTLTQAQAEW